MTQPDKPSLTATELAAVTDAFFQRLLAETTNAGCNDVLDDEFPASVCAKFTDDVELLEAWHAALGRMLLSLHGGA